MSQRHRKRGESHEPPRPVQSDALYKVLLLGESLVGKTSILKRFIYGKWEDETRTTIGVDFLNKVVRIDDKNIELQIWDTAGQEKYRTITRNYVREADGVIVVFDITDADSFKNLQEWFDFIEEMGLSEATVIILGNKCDAEGQRMISSESADQFANKNSVQYLEVSAKQGKNIDEAFNRLALQLVEKNNPRLLDMYKQSNDKGFAFDYSMELPRAPNVHEQHTTNTVEPAAADHMSNFSGHVVHNSRLRRRIRLSSRRSSKRHHHDCCQM